MKREEILNKFSKEELADFLESISEENCRYCELKIFCDESEQQCCIAVEINERLEM